MKRKLILCAFLIGAITNCFGQIPADSLSVYYPFNGGTQDESGNELHAVLEGASLASDRFLNANSAYTFNGFSDHMQVPYSELLQVDFPFSISIWVNVESFSDETSVLFTNDESDFYSGFWILYNQNGRVSAGYGDGTGFGAQFRRTKHSTIWLETSNWHHIVASFNDLNDIDLYIDCQEDPGFYSGSGTSLMNNGQTGVIGRDLGSHPNSYHHGAIDDIRVYRRALSSSETLSLCEEDNTVSIHELEEEGTSVVVSPNPVSDQLQVTLHESYPIDGTSIQIMDISGRIVDEKIFYDSVLTLSSHLWGSSGIYFGLILNEGGRNPQRVKIIKH